MKGKGVSTPLVAVLAVLLALGAGVQGAEADSAIKLIVRADDIGSSHAANLACIQSYREGIARSVEVMVPCPWFNEAAGMLRANPGYDVGVHLTLTSEWANYPGRSERTLLPDDEPAVELPAQHGLPPGQVEYPRGGERVTSPDRAGGEGDSAGFASEQSHGYAHQHARVASAGAEAGERIQATG